jgi:tetratricopeptide (TPR) repeat protein
MLTRCARPLALAGLAVIVFVAGAVGADAREASLRGAEMTGYGRISLQFDRPTKVSARVANGILMISFAGPVAIRSEKLVAELPSYVSIVRRDPDGTGLRVALAKVFRPNVLEAGEWVFIDLLPESWSGLPPGLPQEVVTELARRAQEAESQVRDESRRRLTEAPKPVVVRVAQLPTLTRAVFVPPKLVPISLKANGGEVELLFEGALTIEAGKLRSQLGAPVRAVSAQPAPGSLIVKLTLDEGYTARGFREDETFVLDLAKPKQASPAVGEAAPPEPAVTEPPAAHASANGQSSRAAAPAETPAPQGAAPTRAQPTNVPSGASAPPQAPSGPLRPTIVASPDGLRVVFPFATPVAAAAFERGGLVTVLFDTPQPIEPPILPGDARAYAKSLEATRDGSLAIVRLALTEPQLIRFVPEDKGWALTIGDKGLVASEALTLTRKTDDAGRNAATVSLAGASGVHWLRESQSGERLAVVTAAGPSRSIVKPQDLVEFRLLQSAHGMVVAAEADDLAVAAHAEGIAISRPSGLTLSMPSLPSEPEPGERNRLLVDRDEWRTARLGNVPERHRGLMQETVEAPAAELGAARVRLARFLAAIGSNGEAAAVLDVAAQGDPMLLRDSRVLLLRGIAAARMRRIAEARKFLAAEPLLEDGEAILWRAVVDAQDKRWPAALAGFRRANLVLDLYPDDLQGPMRLLAARAGIELREHAYAENELIALGQLPAGSYSRHEAALLRARLEEAAGRADVAIDIYRKVANEGERPVAAEATLRWMALGVDNGSVPADEAIARLETLSVVWRGDDIEIATLGRLGRLYAEAGRWREAFTMATRANALFPDHETSRALHEDTARLFDELFLSGKGETLSRIDALALYFDFKQFTPIGRRGDEIVRRLADRLVELDLLEQAGELLQYQVDQRLTGAARATVAARLATVRLMDGKPALALSVLHATRLPELPAPIKRARMLLEARALSDLARTELAIEVLRDEMGPEIERLRADIYWTGRRWREAGEAHEGLVGTRWQAAEPLSERDRLDVLRAAVAYSLGDERLARDRLRAKFAARMADSADARTFAFLTRPNIANTRPFREIARSVTSADTLADFLAEYRKRYPDAAAAERRRPRPDAPSPEPAGRSQAQSSQDSPASPNG